MSRIIYLEPFDWTPIKEIRWKDIGGHLYRYDFKEPTKDEIDNLITKIVEAVHDGCSKDVIYDILINPKFTKENL